MSLYIKYSIWWYLSLMDLLPSRQWRQRVAALQRQWQRQWHHFCWWTRPARCAAWGDGWTWWWVWFWWAMELATKGLINPSQLLYESSQVPLKSPNGAILGFRFGFVKKNSLRIIHGKHGKHVGKYAYLESDILGHWPLVTRLKEAKVEIFQRKDP